MHDFMKQVTQNKKTGDLSIVDLPLPTLREGMVLVKNYASVISAGTEKTTIDNRKASLLQRAKSQPDEVRKVVEEARRTGLVPTYKRIMGKLDSAAGLGYSTAGIVLAVDPSVTDLEVGDRVACAGAEYAFHSDVIVVPRNLVAKVPDGVSLELAAYSTVAAIALQGVRQAEPTLGETVVVIGLGLLGQLTVQFLRAQGCNVIGVDLDPTVIELARTSGANLALHRHEDPVTSIVLSATQGYGADAVIITAGTKDNDPIVLSGTFIRERGRLIIVGATPIDVPRSPFYQKEVEVRISRSYGPGRYDHGYEAKGFEYPIGYVRWTENRNMQAYLDLTSQGRITPGILTTHRFSIEDAMQAYALIEGEKTEPYVGILLTYGDLPESELKTLSPPPPADLTISSKRRSLSVGFLGAGNFASGFLLPHLKAMDDVTLELVCNRTGLTSNDMRAKFGFADHTTVPDDIFRNESIGTVFIATRHGDHATLTMQALRSGQHVFVEKPLALTEDELEEVESFVRGIESLPDVRQILMVGYNRRFSPLVMALRDYFAAYREPAIVHYYVNAGFLPKDHWTHDPVEGGGRIIGEVCHFVDTIQYLTGSLPARIHAEYMRTDNTAIEPYDNVHITMRMENGSLGLITYASNGDTSLPKERITMSCGNATGVMNNFTELLLSRGGKKEMKKSAGDKGHHNEVVTFMDAIRARQREVIPYSSLFATSRATFRIMESLRTTQVLPLVLPRMHEGE